MIRNFVLVLVALAGLAVGCEDQAAPEAAPQPKEPEAGKVVAPAPTQTPTPGGSTGVIPSKLPGTTVPAPTTTAAAPAPTSAKKTYEVEHADYLIKIAETQKVSWEEILLLNETFLKEKYDKVCAHKSAKYKNRKKGHYCNERFARPYGNTLQAGWILTMPSAEQAPTKIAEAIRESTGSRIAIVVDDTGSMQDNRHEVAAFYASAVKAYGKSLVGVWLYADGKVRRYVDSGSVQFLNQGGHENTWGALREAAKEHPDTIVLVTDEPGDDWPQSFQKGDVPPVIAHCLSEYGGHISCRSTLTHLVSIVGGKYVEGQ